MDRPLVDEPLHERDLAGDPITQFQRWFAEVRQLNLPEPDAAVLATATADGVPSARVVLVRGVGQDGFRFYTNYDSRKGRELNDNPRAALVFHWQDLCRQVRVEGRIARATREASEAYFRGRPRGSQISAWASPQSQVIASREALEQMAAELEQRFAEQPVPVPPNWGGYVLTPHAIEFWRHRNSRRHDRLRYQRGADDRWVVQRLAP